MSATVDRQEIIRTIRARGNLTADEIAAIMERSVLAIRPRVAELHSAGSLHPTMERRPNVSGKLATVWTAQRR